MSLSLKIINQKQQRQTSVAASLANEKDLVAVIGPATSGAFKATIPNMKKLEFLAITPSGTDDSITKDKMASMKISLERVSKILFKELSWLNMLVII